MLNKFVIVICISSLQNIFSAPASETSETTTQRPDLCKQVVIAHRGASGYIPEHTLAAYALAVFMGADYIEPDLVMTKDGQLVTLHDNELSLTTDVAKRHEFATRRRNQTVDGKQITGWFTEDFTLEEIKTLRAVERIPTVRPGNARMDGTFNIVTLQEIIDLVRGLQLSQKRVIGIYPEIKHSTHFKRLGLPMERLIVETFKNNSYYKSTDPVYIQSFEVSNLQDLKKYTDLKLLQLYTSDKSLQPYDQVELGSSLTFGDMATAEGLTNVAKYASAVGPDKSYIIPRDENNRLGEVTSFVENAHKAGLRVHPYTFRAENSFLPAEFRSNGSSADFGDFSSEMRSFLATGIDGVFSEQPDISVRVRGPC